MTTYPFPSRGFGRNRERTSGLLFAFGVDDLNLSPPSGQTLTFTRATGRTVLDSLGRVVTLAHSQVPWGAQYNSAAALYEPVYDAQSARTNVCLRSEDFGTTWSATGTPTRTAAALKCGDVSLDLIGDDSAGAIEYYSQTITFTGNAVKAVSCFVAQGTSTSSIINLFDATAGVPTMAAVITWSAGLPVVTMISTYGTYIGYVACANSVFRLLFQSTTVTAANTNLLLVIPATDAVSSVANTGTFYVGGVQVENRVTPGAYVKTLGTTVTANVDALSATVTIPIADFTVYVRAARPAWAGLTTGWTANLPICGQPTTSNNGQWYLNYDPTNQRVQAGIVQAGSGQVAYQTIPATTQFDVCAQWTALGTAGKCRIDAGAGFGSYSSTVAAITAWDSNTLLIGSESTTAIDAGIRKVVVASGARTLAQMRGLSV